MSRRLRRGYQLVRTQPRAALAGLLVTPAVHLLLKRRLVSFTASVERIERRWLPRPGSETDARQIGAAVHAAIGLWRLHDSSCLARALTTFALCRRAGLDATIRLGVDPMDRRRAHAWVELDGEPIDDTGDVHDRYVAFDEPFNGHG